MYTRWSRWDDVIGKQLFGIDAIKRIVLIAEFAVHAYVPFFIQYGLDFLHTDHT